MNSADAPSPTGQRDGEGRPAGPPPPGIAAAIAEVSERASVLIRDEVELAKAEISEKATRLAKGAIVGVAAGVFFLVALFFVLVGCAWLLYYELPIGNEFTFFWGFFVMAAILVILGVIAGLLAARALRSGVPPTPNMAIEEARKIRETVSAPTPQPTPVLSGPSAPPIPQPGAAVEADAGKGGGYGTAISG